VPIETRNVDWERVKLCLASIDRTSRTFLQQAFLIGGAACWFYRNQLARANDPDFVVPVLSAENESVWLSKDIDFGGVFGEEILAQLPAFVEEREGHKHAVVNGVRIGYLQAGVTINPEEAISTARIGMVSVDERSVKFLVADPLTLYFEKKKLTQTRSHQNDWFHVALLHDFICYELVTGAENWIRNAAVIDVVESRRILDGWLKVKNKAPEILRDPRILKRLNPLINEKHPIAWCLAGI
jgi:hypothetical protein